MRVATLTRSVGFAGQPVKPRPLTPARARRHPGRLRSTPKASDEAEEGPDGPGGELGGAGGRAARERAAPRSRRRDDVGHGEDGERVAGQGAGEVAVEQVVDGAQGAAARAVEAGERAGTGRSGSGRAGWGRRRTAAPAARQPATGGERRHGAAAPRRRSPGTGGEGARRPSVGSVRRPGRRVAAIADRSRRAATTRTSSTTPTIAPHRRTAGPCARSPARRRSRRLNLLLTWAANTIEAMPSGRQQNRVHRIAQTR